ncbi:hypothetical protein BST61_g10171 [Cercospora zeina]
MLGSGEAAALGRRRTRPRCDLSRRLEQRPHYSRSKRVEDGGPPRPLERSPFRLIMCFHRMCKGPPVCNSPPPWRGR